MKGILLIKFTKSPGAYIDSEYPKKISEVLNIDPADLMNIYGVHRMRRTDPNYLQMRLKDINIASFYTGYYTEDYVGATDCVLTVIISDDDVLPQEFEGMLRRIAHNALPLKEEPSFYETFVDFYKKLEMGDVSPYWYEQLEGVEVQIPEVAATNKFIEVSMDEVNFDDYFDISELELLRARVHKLTSSIIHQNVIIEKLQNTINEGLSDKSHEIKVIHNLKDQIDDLQERNAELNEENIRLIEAIKNLQGGSKDKDLEKLKDLRRT